MIFYIAHDDNGHRQLCGTQADARAVNKSFDQVDIPTDKAGLMGYVQQLLNEIDQRQEVYVPFPPVTEPVVDSPPPPEPPSAQPNSWVSKRAAENERKLNIFEAIVDADPHLLRSILLAAMERSIEVAAEHRSNVRQFVESLRKHST